MHRKGLYEKYIKRFLDVVFSAISLLVLSPLLCIVAILVRIKLGKPVIFRQERPGRIDHRSGKEVIFPLYKFRTMTDQRDGEGNLLPDEVRLTKFGKLLRSTSLDELPELYNVLRGDMSIVGPRPLLVKYLPLYNEEQRHRHDVRPGITGLAQVNGRNGISWDEKFNWDITYVENLSLLTDIKIIFKTIFVVLGKHDITSKTSVTMEAFKGNEDMK